MSFDLTSVKRNCQYTYHHCNTTKSACFLHGVSLCSAPYKQKPQSASTRLALLMEANCAVCGKKN